MYVLIKLYFTLESKNFGSIRIYIKMCSVTLSFYFLFKVISYSF